MKKLNHKQSSTLVGILSRNFQYQTPTPVVEDGKVTRYNLTMFSDDYRRMIGIVNASGGFVMPPEDREKLAKYFAEKAKTAVGGYDLSSWNMGELAAAHEEVKNIDELAAFDKAIGEEMKKRSVTRRSA